MSYPVTLEEVKSHLRLEPNFFDDDDYIYDLVIPAAVEYCKNFIDGETELTAENCLPTVKQAILICAADLYDVERNSYTIGSIKRNEVINRLLLYHKQIEW